MNWRLVTDLAVFIPYSDHEEEQATVYLSAVDKKTLELSVIKDISGCYDKISIDSNEFQLKIDKSPGCVTFEEDIDLGIYIKSPKFPKDNWYYVKNYCGNFAELITQLKSDCGEFNGYTFSATFNDKYPSVVNFSCKEMKEYNHCFEEMKRRLNCEFFKKTKKWIPGHRYDSLSNTYYYLTSVKSRRKDNKCSDFIDDETKCEEVYLVVSDLKEGENSISDVLKNRTFGTGEDDIQVLKSQLNMVDSGEGLKDDYTDFEDYLEWLIPNSIKKCRKVQKFGYVTYENPKLFFDIFAYFNRTPDYSKKLKTGIPPVNYAYRIVKDLVFDCILKNWNQNSYREDLIINSTKSVEDNLKSLNNLFLTIGIKDENALRNLYYSGLYKKIGLDLNAILIDTLDDWDENTVVYGSFDNYLKFISYTEQRLKNQYVSQQRVNSTTYKLETNTLNDIFGETELKDSLIELVNYAKSNIGLGIDSYRILNIGTKKSPKEFISCTVTINNLIDFKSKKGELELSETLKHDILLAKFCQVSVSFDRDSEIK